MHTKTIKELSTLLQSKAISATELATHFLDRIETVSYTHLTLPTIYSV